MKIVQIRSFFWSVFGYLLRSVILTLKFLLKFRFKYSLIKYIISNKILFVNNNNNNRNNNSNNNNNNNDNNNNDNNNNNNNSNNNNNNNI